MKVIINGAPRELPPVKTVAELIAAMAENVSHFAVAVNGSFIPRAEYGETAVRENDDVEIVAPFPGG